MSLTRRRSKKGRMCLRLSRSIRREEAARVYGQVAWVSVLARSISCISCRCHMGMGYFSTRKSKHAADRLFVSPTRHSFRARLWLRSVPLGSFRRTPNSDFTGKQHFARPWTRTCEGETHECAAAGTDTSARLRARSSRSRARSAGLIPSAPPPPCARLSLSRPSTLSAPSPSP